MVFRVARVLTSEQILDETIIVPTVAFAARIAEGVPESFMESFDCLQTHAGLTFMRTKNGVPILCQEPATVEIERYAGTELVRRVTIRAFSKSAKPERVAQLYEQTLRKEYKRIVRGKEDPFEGCLRLTIGAPEISNAHLVISVHPDRELHPNAACYLSENPDESRPAFPPPGYVNRMYEATLGYVHMDEGRSWGFSYALPGRQSGRRRMPKKLILACVAVYVNNHAHLSELSSNQRSRTAQLINQHVLCPCGEPELLEGSSDKRDNILRTLEDASQNLLRTEYLILKTFP